MELFYHICVYTQDPWCDRDAISCLYILTDAELLNMGKKNEDVRLLVVSDIFRKHISDDLSLFSEQLVFFGVNDHA